MLVTSAEDEDSKTINNLNFSLESILRFIHVKQVQNPSGFHETLTWTASLFERVSEWTVRDSTMVQKEGGSRSSVSY